MWESGSWNPKMWGSWSRKPRMYGSGSRKPRTSRSVQRNLKLWRFGSLKPRLWGPEVKKGWRSGNQKQRMGEPYLWRQGCGIRIPEAKNVGSGSLSHEVRGSGSGLAVWYFLWLNLIRVHPNWRSWVDSISKPLHPPPSTLLPPLPITSYIFWTSCFQQRGDDRIFPWI
jgi:hypothetical protein